MGWCSTLLADTYPISIQVQTEPYGALRGFMGPNRTIWDYTGPYGTIKNHTRLYSAIRGHKGPYGSILGHWVIWGHTQDHARPKGGHTGPNEAIMGCDHTGPKEALGDHAGPCGSIRGNTRPTEAIRGQIGPYIVTESYWPYEIKLGHMGAYRANRSHRWPTCLCEPNGYLVE